MESLRPSVPVSVPAVAAGGQSGISDVSATQVVSNTEAIDKAPDARLNLQPAADGDTLSRNSGLGTGEQKASVASNGQTTPSTTTAAPAAEAPLPTNHPPTKDQLKAFKKQQEKAAKLAKKNAAKTGATTTTTPAQPAATTSGTATPAAAATPRQ
jgi:hypothetical protein